MVEMERECGASPTPSCKGWHRRSAQRPTELFDAALRVFADKGFRAARLEDVAREAGVTKALIYHYFESKEDLLIQALDRRMHAFLDGMREELSKLSGTAVERIRHVMEIYRKRWSGPEWGRFHHLMMGELVNENRDLFRQWMQHGMAQRWEIVENLILDGQKNGEFRPEVSARAVARFLVSGLAHVIALERHYGVSDFSPCSSDATFSENLELVLRGLAATPPSRKKL